MTTLSSTSETAGARRPWTAAQRFALAFGLVYGAVAVAGYVETGFTGFSAHEHATLVVFAVNPLHNLIHAVLAIAALSAAARPGAARMVDLALGVVLGLVTVVGAFGWLGMLGMSGLADPDNFLHLATAALALYFGSAGDQHSADDADADADLLR